MGEFKILECTLRDGGKGLEDCKKNGYPDQRFNNDDKIMITRLLTDANMDIIELGIIDPFGKDRDGYAVYKSIEELSETIPSKKNANQIYAGLFEGPDADVLEIPEYNEKMCQMIRVIIRYSEFQRSLDFCKLLSQKGYLVSVQPMLTMRYTEEEILKMIAVANEINAFALYFVDSYGYMSFADIDRLFSLYDKGLDRDINIGFHAHNHMNMAFGNSMHFLQNRGDRNVIVDSCVLGMGQGAGNLQTELLVGELKYNCKLDRYDYSKILEAAEIIENYVGENKWGYNVSRVLSALHKTAHNYAVNMRHKYKLSYADIDRGLSDLGEDLIHRYTADNLKKIIEKLER